MKKQENGGFLLNPQQKIAAEAPISPLLIVAGAGTGKTRTLTSRILHLIKEGMPPERICAITFTNKAAAEMADRIRRGAPHGTKPYIGTFHSLGARILRKECRMLGREPNFAIFDDHDSFDLVKKAMKVALSKEISEKKKKKENAAFFAREISEIKNLDAAAKSKNISEKNPDVMRIFTLYEEALERNNAFDFDDLIEKPVAMFQSHPAILKKYQGMFDAVLVDEYQDINPKQYEFIRLLAEGHQNITVVGDDEQTIYSWRHADIKIFLNFDKDWPRAKVHFLEENYRSTGNIINAASAVVQNNRFRTPKKLWTRAEGGEPITIFEAWGENDEAAWIAEEAGKLRISSAKQHAEHAPTTAILYRTNAQSRAIEQALIRANIPYQIFGGLKFYERREVKDAVAALRYASNKKDEISKERLEKNLSKKKFVAFRNAIPADAKPKPTDILKVFLASFSYFDYLESNFLNADERQENIAELINFASGFEDLGELLERLSLLQATDDVREDAAEKKDHAPKQDKVTLMTIHMAKGLEFDAVFIAGAAEGLLPHIRSIDAEASIEEERRLMYVAMTRARKKLSISYYGMPSRFVAEIPNESVRLAASAYGGDPEKEGGSNAVEHAYSDDDDVAQENIVEF